MSEVTAMPEKPKVFIIFENDGYGDWRVGRVFASRSDAEEAISGGGYFNAIEEYEVE